MNPDMKVEIDIKNHVIWMAIPKSHDSQSNDQETKTFQLTNRYYIIDRNFLLLIIGCETVVSSEQGMKESLLLQFLGVWVNTAFFCTGGLNRPKTLSKVK